MVRLEEEKASLADGCEPRGIVARCDWADTPGSHLQNPAQAAADEERATPDSFSTP